MQDLLKKIRERSSLSQMEMADKLGVSFATINRWENGHVLPNNLAQMKLYEFCEKHSFPLFDYITQKIQNTAANIELDKNRILLYHGSKSGLSGPLVPVSRDRCDFGSGFYLGDNPAQPLTLVCDFEKSKFYIVSIDIIALKTIEIPTNIDWAMLVAYHRGRMESIKGSDFYKKYAEMIMDADLVIGNIADDRMFFVLDSFFQEQITDIALIQSLSALQLGHQYVAVTKKACDAIRIEREVNLSLIERKCLQTLNLENREKGVALANEISKNYRREGKYFDEILAGAIKGTN